MRREGEWLGDGEKAKRASGLGGCSPHCWRCPRCTLLAALIGSLIPVNRGWTEPAQGTTIYIADNGIHADIIMPVKAQGLDWAAVVAEERLRSARPERALDRLRFGRAARLSRHADLVGH